MFGDGSVRRPFNHGWIFIRFDIQHVQLQILQRSADSPVRFLTHFDVMQKCSIPERESEQNFTCLSPEKNASWVLDGQCLDQPHHSLSPLSTNTSRRRTCGLCGPETAYLRELRDELESKYRQICNRLVVYGAALGTQYSQWMQDAELLGSHNSIHQPGTCFFQFVTDDFEGSTKTHSVDGLQILISLKTSRMPYSNNRRNVKLLKLNPGLIFPWARRVIWQDAKLLQLKTGLPSNYLRHFESTVGHFGACASFMGMPNHPNTVYGSESVTLMAHCNAIMKAAMKRPTVSDGLGALCAQCREYYSRYGSANDTRSQPFHEHPLIDSAFIVWSMQSEVCRQFNGNFGCSWLDEIHCYSDRDQVSFTSNLVSTDLRLASSDGTTVSDDIVYSNQANKPMVHIKSPICHWYFGNFSDCVTSQEVSVHTTEHENSPSEVTLEKNGSRLRVAVVVAGTLQRLMFNSTLEKVLKPLVEKEGVIVDYFLHLTTTSGKPYRSESSYMDRIGRDLIFEGYNRTADIQRFIRTEVNKVKASVGALMLEDTVDIDSEKLLAARRAMAQEKYPSEDPDLRFPTFDIRSEKIAERTANANRNMLRLHLATQKLWRTAVQREKDGDFQYDFVLFLRDDSLWLAEFSLDPFVSLPDSDVFLPSCDAREPPMDPNEYSDHLLLSRRSSADIIGNYYSKLFETDLQACADRLSGTIRKNGSRGCNSEMLLKWVIDKESLRVGRVAQSMVAFQRSVNVQLPNGSYMTCFHKYCQSKSSPVDLSSVNIDKCSDIHWDDLSVSALNWAANRIGRAVPAIGAIAGRILRTSHGARRLF